MTDQSSGQGVPPPENTASIIVTDYTVGQHNVEGKVGPFGFDIHNPVFMVSGLSIVAFVFFALALCQSPRHFHMDVTGPEFVQHLLVDASQGRFAAGRAC